METTRQGKLDALTRILDMALPDSAMIFVRTKRETDELGEALIGRGYQAEVIHGGDKGWTTSNGLKTI